MGLHTLQTPLTPAMSTSLSLLPVSLESLPTQSNCSGPTLRMPQMQPRITRLGTLLWKNHFPQVVVAVDREIQGLESTFDVAPPPPSPSHRSVSNTTEQAKCWTNSCWKNEQLAESAQREALGRRSAVTASHLALSVTWVSLKIVSSQLPLQRPACPPARHTLPVMMLMASNQTASPKETLLSCSGFGVLPQR